MANAKNQVNELLDARGLPRNLASYARSRADTGAWVSTLTLRLPGCAPLVGTGTGPRATQAEIAAAEEVLALLVGAEGQTEEWCRIQADAQAGDALLKLAAYVAPDLPTACDRSSWLQRHESDVALAQVFNRWFDAGVPELVPYGAGLGEKAKSTLVEALIWRRYAKRILASGAEGALAELRGALSAA